MGRFAFGPPNLDQWRDLDFVVKFELGLEIYDLSFALKHFEQLGSFTLLSV